jgi:acetylornithine deacetylase/succinyl-diaminopimelate desuccinylase-like protein
MPTIDDVLGRLDANQTGALERLFELLRIPSVSTDPNHAADCELAADWLVNELQGLGFDVSKRATDGKPMVVGHAKGMRRDAPHVLFYGHYDVQPPEPLELWRKPPFEPQLVDAPTGAQIVARGACDDKGQLMTFVEACRAFRESGGLPCDVSVLFEGEEEIGSPSLPAFMAKNAKELKADIMLVCDTAMWDRTTPAITTMLRGLVYEEVIVRAANRDLHSGVFGGAAMNPIRALAAALNALHDENGAVAIPGFYDGVEELPEEIATQWRELNFNEETFLSDIGLSVPAGEKGRSVLEMLWSRPTCDVNGIVGGFTGHGAKTVIPAEARAKVSFRLVGRQNPEKISQYFRNFIKARLPADVKAEFLGHSTAPAIQLSTKSEALRRARRALEGEWGKPALLIGSGGSIPIVGSFKRELNMDSLLVGFALDDDNVHSPNEKYDRSSFHKGARSWARILTALAS